MNIVKYRTVFYTISIILLVASFAAMATWGFNLGIDFKGGSILEVEYGANRPAQAEVVSAVAPLELDASVRAFGETGYILRMRDITPEEKSSLLTTLNTLGSTTERRFDSIGPVLGTEALRKAMISIVLVILAIVLFIAFAFRKVSEPISSWKYGIVAILALVHDVIIPTGVYAVLGHFKGYEIDTLFITALLVVLGFSVHDTIVVFDRVREHLKNGTGKKPFEQIVGESVSETFTRSINTSLTTLFALVVLYFVGGTATQSFSLVLIIGIIAGTYSSIFIGSPLLVTIEKWQRGKDNKRK
jgi:preprotein translocase subunit SecF